MQQTWAWERRYILYWIQNGQENARGWFKKMLFLVKELYKNDQNILILLCKQLLIWFPFSHSFRFLFNFISFPYVFSLPLHSFLHSFIPSFNSIQFNSIPFNSFQFPFQFPFHSISISIPSFTRTHLTWWFFEIPPLMFQAAWAKINFETFQVLNPFRCSPPLGGGSSSSTLPKFNIAPENRPSQ